MLNICPILYFSLLNFILTSALSAESIWVEGEAADSHTFVKNGWYDDVMKESFSGKKWLSHYTKDRAGVAKYSFESKKSGSFVFWLRCNYFRSEMSYKLNRGSWKGLSIDDRDPNQVRDKMMVSKKPDHRFIGWVRVGSVKLKKGKNQIEIKISSKLANHGAIDCFCFSDEGFVPSGSTKPDLSKKKNPSAWFPVVVDQDTYSKKSVWDQTQALHRPAGKYGFLKRDGKDLKFEKQSPPIKFWGVGANIDARIDRKQQTLRVKYMAKLGLNMVREHPLAKFLGPLRNGKLDPARLDAYDWWFAELKKHGIYSTWSVFYRQKVSAADGYPRALLKELEKGNTYGVVNFSRKLQDLQMEYVKVLLDHKNPYTGLRYRDDPALAVLEIQNEDCIFFHFPLSVLAEGKTWPEHSRLLRKLFFKWSLKKHGSERKVRSFWGRRVDLAEKEIALYAAWELRGKKVERRHGEFVEFLTDIQRKFYLRREKEYRQAGFKGVTVTTAWRAGGAGADAANLYCDTAMDMIDRHNYFGGGAERHRIISGKVKNGTHLRRAGSGILSSGLYQVEDQPFAMTEWTQCPPNQWKAECAPLIAFYGMGLQGWDASYHFNSSRSRLGDGWPGLSYYTSDTPHYAGQFPALAIAVREGHIKEGKIVAARRVQPKDLFKGADVLGQDLTGGGHDEKSLVGQPLTPPEVLAIGRVTTSFKGGKSEKVDFTKYWDQKSGIIRSQTGELEWNTKKGIVLVKSPKTQAVIGFGGGEKIELPDFEIQLETKFVSLIFTSLDQQSLKSSKSVLITAMARDQQTGSEYSEDGSVLKVVGGPPLLLEPVQAKIKILGKKVLKVRPLDFHGVPRSTSIPIKKQILEIDGRFQAYHYHLTR